MSISDSMWFAIAADARYSDSYLASGFNHPLSKIDSYWYFDASIRVGSDDGRWEVALIGKNLSDEFYVSGVVDGPSTGDPAGADGRLADQLGFGNIPRTWALEATLRF
jgi:outer membrane receptor protein involved in Fe transport